MLRTALFLIATLPFCVSLAAQHAIERLPSPAGNGSAQPSLTTGPDGRVYLNWQVKEGDDVLLRFAIWNGESFAEARTITRGPDLLANWADFPSLAATSDGLLTAHWMVRRDQRYSYDVYVSRSADEGKTWTEPVLLHKDGKLAEHGFVSFIPHPDGRLGAVWLDGREMAAAEGSSGDGHGHGGSGGAMTVRYAELDSQGRPGKRQVLDARVCECCQTDAAATSAGAVAAFRDRSPEEVRDIGIAVYDDRQEAWQETSIVAPDHWKIPGCPVNGPRLDADGDRVALAWFTMGRDGVPKVKAAFSTDAGRTFSTPTVISQGLTLGRLDTLLLPDGSAVVALLEKAGKEAADPDIRLKRITPDGTLTHDLKVAPTSARRPSGFPRLALSHNHIYIAWTDLAADQVRLARLHLPE
ncbi:MAG TPA: sialidase family protein [Acidobacteriota bacterium]|nr:sialidase family protein [Acidobacteriota bacterium]